MINQLQQFQNDPDLAFGYIRADWVSRDQKGVPVMNARNGRYAVYSNPSKFTSPAQWAEEAIQEGNELRRILSGRRILEAFQPALMQPTR